MRPAEHTKGYVSASIGFSVGDDVIIFLNSGVPTNGTTGANLSVKGGLCLDTTNGKAYINTGTKASPTWTVVGTQT